MISTNRLVRRSSAFSTIRFERLLHDPFEDAGSHLVGEFLVAVEHWPDALDEVLVRKVLVKCHHRDPALATMRVKPQIVYFFPIGRRFAICLAHDLQAQARCLPSLAGPRGPVQNLVEWIVFSLGHSFDRRIGFRFVVAAQTIKQLECPVVLFCPSKDIDSALRHGKTHYRRLVRQPCRRLVQPQDMQSVLVIVVVLVVVSVDDTDAAASSEPEPDENDVARFRIAEWIFPMFSRPSGKHIVVRIEFIPTVIFVVVDISY